jgi:hypothetical protein
MRRSTLLELSSMELCWLQHQMLADVRFGSKADITDY